MFCTPGTAWTTHAGIWLKTVPTSVQLFRSVEWRICAAPPETAGSPVENTYQSPWRLSRMIEGSGARRSPVSGSTCGGRPRKPGTVRLDTSATGDSVASDPVESCRGSPPLQSSAANAIPRKPNRPNKGLTK